MKKIVFLDQNLDGGGAERVTCTIIRSLDPVKYDITLILVDKLGQLGYLVPDYVKIIELKISHNRNAFLQVMRILREIKPNIVYSTLHNSTALAVLSKIGIKLKLIARYPSTPSLEVRSKRYVGWRNFIMKCVYPKVDIIIAQNEEMGKEIEKTYKIDKGKIKVIMNPVDTKFINDSLINAKCPFKNEKINVVASGRMGVEKGFDVLIESFAKVVEKNGDFHLHILGRDVDGNLQKFQKRIAELGVSQNVTFHGFHKNPYPFYKFCDLFVLSSRWEGLPNVVLECQYLGKPIVATRCIPVIERLIENGKNGFIVDVEDVGGLAEAILNFRQLKGEKIERDTIGEFVKLFEENNKEK